MVKHDLLQFSVTTREGVEPFVTAPGFYPSSWETKKQKGKYQLAADAISLFEAIAVRCADVDFIEFYLQREVFVAQYVAIPNRVEASIANSLLEMSFTLLSGTAGAMITSNFHRLPSHTPTDYDPFFVAETNIALRQKLGLKQVGFK